MRNSTAPLALLVLIVALAAWAGVLLLFSDISSRLTDRAQASYSASTQSVQQGNAIELHAIVADTALQRTALDSAVDTDVVGIANDIESAGKSAGTQTTIGSASEVGALSAQSGVNEVEFVVQSSGTFQQVWRAAQLYQTLQLPSTVSELDFEQVPGAGKTSIWQLTAHIDVLTSAQISS